MAKLTQADRMERKLDALALAIGGPARLAFDKIGWATRRAEQQSARQKRQTDELERRLARG